MAMVFKDFKTFKELSEEAVNFGTGKQGMV